MLTDENRYKILKLLEQNPDLSQRQVADSLGMSLGKTNDWSGYTIPYLDDELSYHLEEDKSWPIENTIKN